MTCETTNRVVEQVYWLTAVFLYVPPVFFPDTVWFGFAPILFGGVAQLIVHGIYNNLLLKRFYNSGLAAVLFGHVPVALLYIRYIVKNNMADISDWIIAVLIMVGWYVIVLRLVLQKVFSDKNSPFPFDETEMKRFKPPR
jgi:hypothetical protein